MDGKRLKGAIYAHGTTISALATACGFSDSALYRRMNGEIDFSRNEIERIAEVLQLSDDELLAIFFA